MDWAENLKLLMQEHGVGNPELSALVKRAGGQVSRNTITNILAGKNSPKVETLRLIADALGVELLKIFTIPGEKLNGFITSRTAFYFKNWIFILIMYCFLKRE
jgi:transcriptional regulator with XRE-family HTH domain